MKTSKLTSILILTSLSILAIECFRSKKKTDINKNSNNKDNNTDPQVPESKPTEEMKTIYFNTLNALVAANTITQTQSGKVLAVLTSNTQQNTAAIKQNSANTYNETDTAPNAETGNSSNQTGTNYKTPSHNVLSELVTNGLITQAQANTINQKIQIAINKTK